MQTLRRFVKRRLPGENCELCSLPISPDHAHLIQLEGHRLLCCCKPCAVLFDHQRGGVYRRVPRTFEHVTSFQLDDAQWNRLDVPVNLVFFCHYSRAARVVAQYPSPAGAMESQLNLDGWQAIVVANPLLETFEPDVEALLVNRMGHAREYYRVPIDECYRLIGEVRKHWSGISGGSEVPAAIEQFFKQLDGKTIARGAT
jgi:hypothetical protein